MRTIVAFLTAAALTTGCDIVTANLGPEHTSQWQKTYTIAANGSVEIDNVNGKIDVEPGTGNTVEVTAIKKAHGASEEAAKTTLDRITIVEDVSPSHVKVEAKFPHSDGGMFVGGGNGTVEFQVKVPAGIEGTFHTVNGGVGVRGLQGHVTAQTTNGGVIARDMSGQLDARTTNGGLDIDLAKISDGGVMLRCTNGGIHVRLPRDAKATISASITNGGISTSDLPLDTSESSRRRLDARMNGGGPRVEADGTNGGISLTSR